MSDKRTPPPAEPNADERKSGGNETDMAEDKADEANVIGAGGQTVDQHGNPAAAGQQGGGPGAVPSQAEGERDKAPAEGSDQAVEDKGEKTERGQRPSIAPDGTVHGSGSGAGGGNPGEDYDEDATAGGGHGAYHGAKPIEKADKPRDKHQGTGS